jgi:hypothetical protein
VPTTSFTTDPNTEYVTTICRDAPDAVGVVSLPQPESAAAHAAIAATSVVRERFIIGTIPIPVSSIPLAARFSSANQIAGIES